MSGSLEIHGTSLAGNLSGTAVNCQLHATQPGSLPPPGVYEVQVPHHDTLFGAVVLVHKVHVAASPGFAALRFKGEYSPSAGQAVMAKLGLGSAKPNVPAVKAAFSPEERAQTAGPPQGGAGSSSAKFVPRAWTKDVDKSSVPSNPNPVYVLTSRAIPGRNCLVVTTGFSDLIAGLTAAGGARLSVH